MGHSPGLNVLSAGDNGWLSRVTHPGAAVTTAWEKRNGFQVHVCVPRRCLGHCTVAAGGRGGLISPKTEESVQPAVGQIEQLKGCKKIRGDILAGLAFLF